jgi:DNA-binding GntR family transcriptional regulator
MPGMQKLTAADATAPPDVKRAKYRQLADAIRTQIADGYLQPGEKLPAIGDLAAMTGVSSSVVRQALGVLEAEGAVKQRKGAAAKVTDAMQVAPAGQVRELSMARYVEQNTAILKGARPVTSDFAAGHGIDFDEYQIDFSVSHGQATPKDCELLRLQPGSLVWRRTFVKYAAGQPVEIQRSAVPEWVVDRADWMVDPACQPYRGGTQWELADAGLKPRHVRHTTVARLATEEEERVLKHRVVLDVTRELSTRYGTRVEASRLVLPGNRHRLVEQITLRTQIQVRGGN